MIFSVPQISLVRVSHTNCIILECTTENKRNLREEPLTKNICATEYKSNRQEITRNIIFKILQLTGQLVLQVIKPDKQACYT